MKKKQIKRNKKQIIKKTSLMVAETKENERHAGPGHTKKIAHERTKIKSRTQPKACTKNKGKEQEDNK